MTNSIQIWGRNEDLSHFDLDRTKKQPENAPNGGRSFGMKKRNFAKVRASMLHSSAWTIEAATQGVMKWPFGGLVGVCFLACYCYTHDPRLINRMVN